jgi:predicted dehydrogenase
MQLLDGDWTLEGDRLTEDPTVHGGIGFENGVVAYAVPSAQDVAFEARCADGTLRVTQQHLYSMRRRENPGQRRSPFVDVPFPDWQPISANLRLVQDLVRSLDTGEPPAGGVRVAYAATELTFAAIESHLRGGARVDLPLTGSTVRLERDRAPRQPRLEP